jgi:PAS domain S-box-containing protein
LEGISVYVPDVFELTPEDGVRQIIEPQGIKSLLAVPMMKGGQCFGFIGFDSVRQKHIYTENEQHILKEFTNILLSALQRKELERKLEDTLQRYKTIVYNSPGAIFRCKNDDDWTMLFISEAIEEITGYASKELINNEKRTYNSIISPEDRKMVSDAVNKGINKKQAYSIEYRVIDKKGSIKWIGENAQIVLDQNGEVKYIDGIIMDITDRKKAEQFLKKISHAVDNSPAIVVISDAEGNIEYVNPKFTFVTGYEYDDVIGKNTSMMRSGVHNQSFYQDMWDTLTAGKEWRGEICNKTKAGALYWESASISPIRNEKSIITHYVAIKEDINHKKLAEIELEKTNIMLEEARKAAENANNAKTNFLANMSHEIRTPMNAILGFAYLFAKDEKLDNNQRNNIKNITRSGEHLLKIINEILDMSKIESGYSQLYEEKFDLNELLNDMEIMLSHQAKKLGLGFEIKKDLSGVRLIKGDEVKIRQILVNLIGNAIKFTNSGSVTIRANAKIEAESYAEINISVEDTGIGIAEEDISMIFQPFYQKFDYRSNGGTGLGLPISKKFAEMMGGDLKVKSIEGKGSLFTLSLKVPILKNENDFLLAGKNCSEGLCITEEKKRILVVDDHDEQRQLLVDLLNRFNFEVVEAVNGEEAIMLYESNDFHAVISDIRMPKVDGLKVCRHVKSKNDGKSFVMIVSANAFEEDRFRATEAGADYFLPKPYHPENLLKKLSNGLGISLSFEKNDIVLKEDSSESKLPVTLEISVNILDEIEDSLNRGDIGKIMSTLDKIEMENHGNVQFLKDMADNYDYKGLQDWINKEKPERITND